MARPISRMATCFASDVDSRQLPRRLDASPRRLTSRISTGDGGRVTCDQDICGPQRTRRRRIRKSRTGTATPDRRKLLNHTAGNAGASVSRRIGLHVVCLLVDHNTGTARVEQRSGAIAGEGNVLDCALEGALAVRADRQIRQITSVMTFWVLQGARRKSER